MMVLGSFFGYSQRVPRQMARVYLAAYFGLRETIIALFKDGLDPDIKDIYGWTPLFWAVEHGHEAVVKLLLATDNVNPDFKDIDGRAPLSWAAENGHEVVMTLLLTTDAVDPDSMDNGGRTPLSWAARNGHEKVVQLLLAKDDVDLNSKDEIGRTPLWWAAAKGIKEVVKLLLATKAVDPDSKDNYDQTPLWSAAAGGHEAVTNLLLVDNGVNPDSKDNRGRTPLWLAARKGNPNVVQLLLAKYEENGIDIHDDNVIIATPPAADHESRIYCDICISSIPDVDPHHHCGICSNGDFDLVGEVVGRTSFVSLAERPFHPVHIEPTTEGRRGIGKTCSFPTVFHTLLQSYSEDVGKPMLLNYSPR
jgi:ankyrin repeat protein